MTGMAIREFHQSLNAVFLEVNGVEGIDHYGDPTAEHAALSVCAGMIDLSFRSRLCLTGADRQAFINGQVTNNVKNLKAGEGCYAALVNAKGKLQSDLNIYVLESEVLLDFEPGFSTAVTQRLEKYIIAEDVLVTDVVPSYGLLSVQGPQSAEVVRQLDPALAPPPQPMSFVSRNDSTLGEIYLVNHARTGSSGFDLFVPTPALGAVADKLVAAAKACGGRACGWRALEIARIEAGIPRFGADMDETNLAPEAGIESRAISYSKGCYIGQEVIARIRTYGQVAKSLRGLKLADDLAALPVKGDKLFKDGKEVGYVTSAVAVPTSGRKLALGYVRKEHNAVGTELTLATVQGECRATLVALPFQHG